MRIQHNQRYAVNLFWNFFLMIHISNYIVQRCGSCWVRIRLKVTGIFSVPERSECNMFKYCFRTIKFLNICHKCQCGPQWNGGTCGAIWSCWQALQWSEYFWMVQCTLFLSYIFHSWPWFRICSSIVERVCPQLYKGSFENSHAFLTHIFFLSSDITNVVFLNIGFMLLSTLCPFVYKIFRIKGFGCMQSKLCTAAISSSTFVRLSLPPARVQTGGNRKKLGLEFRLGGQEVSSSIFEGWLLYGQQF